ncbi:hypothetical protein SBDP1_590013 [Syntrophobacter sp. SbD1]|nr:hypothetical protein SBDP1_590013 [Syntrophobacter sp. SbD1]
MWFKVLWAGLSHREKKKTKPAPDSIRGSTGLKQEIKAFDKIYRIQSVTGGHKALT